VLRVDSAYCEAGTMESKGKGLGARLDSSLLGVETRSLNIKDRPVLRILATESALKY